MVVVEEYPSWTCFLWGMMFDLIDAVVHYRDETHTFLWKNLVAERTGFLDWHVGVGYNRGCCLRFGPLEAAPNALSPWCPKKHKVYVFSHTCCFEGLLRVFICFSPNHFFYISIIMNPGFVASDQSLQKRISSLFCKQFKTDLLAYSFVVFCQIVRNPFALSVGLQPIFRRYRLACLGLQISLDICAAKSSGLFRWRSSSRW